MLAYRLARFTIWPQRSPAPFPSVYNRCTLIVAFVHVHNTYIFNNHTPNICLTTKKNLTKYCPTTLLWRHVCVRGLLLYPRASLVLFSRQLTILLLPFPNLPTPHPPNSLSFPCLLNRCDFILLLNTFYPDTYLLLKVREPGRACVNKASGNHVSQVSQHGCP